ncbi:MAG: hypothetical protein MUF54_10775 [Polyangiaceae bacterium]|jgi:hypothetical protein|nr:hypothetical protein [Polyangiaceae bacterium]
MFDEPCLRHGHPLAYHLCLTAERAMTPHQRRALRRAVRDLCLARRWHLIACDLSRHRFQAVIGGQGKAATIHRTLFELCAGSRPRRVWDSSAPVLLYDEADILEACTRTLYEETNGLIGQGHDLCDD